MIYVLVIVKRQKGNYALLSVLSNTLQNILSKIKGVKTSSRLYVMSQTINYCTMLTHQMSPSFWDLHNKKWLSALLQYLHLAINSPSYKYRCINTEEAVYAAYY